MRMHVQLLLLIFAVSSVMGCRGRVSTSPPVHPNWNMDNQWRFDPQEPNDFFEGDRRAMRPQEPGTVSHGSLAATEGLQEHLHEGRIDGAWTDELPPGMALNQAMLDRGSERYQIYCTPCHGGTGMGDGVVVKRGMAAPQPYTDPRLRSYPLGRIVWVLRHGTGNMPSYASQIPVHDRWAISTYVRALQIAGAASLAMVPADVQSTNGWPLPPSAEDSTEGAQ